MFATQDLVEKVGRSYLGEIVKALFGQGGVERK